MLHDLREIPVIDPFATLLALYEMLGLVFRGNAESGSKISREVTHGAIVPWAWAGDASLVRRIKATRQARGFHLFAARPGLLHCPLNLALDFPIFFASYRLPVRWRREPGLAFCLANSSWPSSSSSCGSAANVLEGH
jgi:hypothetical protein